MMKFIALSTDVKKNFFFKFSYWGGETAKIALKIEALAANLGKVSSVPETHTVEGET